VEDTDSQALRPEDVRVIPEDWMAPLPPATMFAEGQPLEVDVGCGKGRFLLARAAAHPAVSFLGIERQLVRVRKVAKKAARAGLRNVRVLRCESSYAIAYLIGAPCVSTYYIFFPDPWPKKRHHKRRLFTPSFLDALAATLVPAGRVHIATDHMNYFEQILQLLRNDARFREIPPFVPREQERTDFELIFLNNEARIGRCSFQRSDD